MKKLLHTGDFHFKVPEKDENFYIERILMLYVYFKKEQPDIIALTGDVFDKTPTVLEVTLFILFLKTFEHIPLLIVPGNHDVGTKKDKAIRHRYLDVIINYLKPANVIYTNSILETDKFLLVSNEYVRAKKEIPALYDKILLSHIRCDLTFSGVQRKGEYDFSELEKFKLVLLSDVHTINQYSERIWYSTSPYRTHIKTINSVSEMDNSFFGFNIVDLDTLEVTHKELHLPNVYKFVTDKRVKLPDTPNLIHTVYEVDADSVGEFMGEDIKIKRTKQQIDTSENLLGIIRKILVADYNVNNPDEYLKVLVELVGEL